MIEAHSPPRLFLLLFFLGLIGTGTGLLMLPWAAGAGGPVAPIDALFTAASAVCVTGLTTVDTAGWSRGGQIVILLLIQAGGLGVIGFSTMYLILPGRRMSMRGRLLVQTYSLGIIEHNPRRIIASVFLVTLGFELVGAALLWAGFAGRVSEPGFAALFHAVSAFCNAGFSLFPDSLEAHGSSPAVVLPVAGLIICGGLGFLLFVDVAQLAAGRRKRLSLHSRTVLAATGTLLILTTTLYLVLERRGVLADATAGARLLSAFFQAVTTRTAGFNTLWQSRLGLPSQGLTMLLMLIGGSSGSAAGGIKVTTAVLVAMQLVRDRDARGEMRLMGRKVSGETLSRAQLFTIRALGLLFACAFLLFVTEAGTGKLAVQLVFESFSAFGTVGLSLGITPALTGAGKVVIILTMFAGRVGIISMAARHARRPVERRIDLPREEVLIG